MAEVVDEEVPVEPAEAARDDRRGDIEAAFEKVSAAGESEEPPEPEAKGEAEPTPKVDGRRNRERDEHGRYIPKGESKVLEPPKGRGRQTAQAELEAPEVKPEKTEAKPQAKADAVENLPAAFKPGMLEAWKALPREAKEEIHRRESEHAAQIAQSKPMREFIAQVQQAVAPYQDLMRAEGGNVVTSLSNYLQAAQLMRTGTPQLKAQWIAKLTKTFTSQEHLSLLDEALAAEFGVNGAKPPETQAAPQYSPQQFRDPRVDEMLAVQEQQRQAELQRGFEEARAEKDSWVAEKSPEFLPWVSTRMATLLEAAAKDNEELSFDEAYEAACRTHPEVRKILAQREEAARAAPAAVAKSRRAAVSLKPTGTVANVSGSVENSRRGDIEDAWEAVMGR